MNYECTKKELADVIGMTTRRLFDIDNSLPEEKKLFVHAEDGKSYDLPTFVRRWVEYNLEKNQGNEMSLDEVRAIHEQVKTKKTELEVARLRGELVEVSAVRQVWGNVANTAMQNLIRIPSKVAPLLVMLPTADVIADIIDKEIRDVLTTIADTPLPAEAMPDDRNEASEVDEEG